MFCAKLILEIKILILCWLQVATLELDILISNNHLKVFNCRSLLEHQSFYGTRVMLYIFIFLDASLDLNMMIIQVRPIISEWFNFGEAIGIPQEILVELNAMTLGDYDKLVEMLDYWFNSFPKVAPPTWRDVAKGLNIIGKNRMASELMKVYDSGSKIIITIHIYT